MNRLIKNIALLFALSVTLAITGCSSSKKSGCGCASGMSSYNK